MDTTVPRAWTTRSSSLRAMRSTPACFALLSVTLFAAGLPAQLSRYAKVATNLLNPNDALVGIARDPVSSRLFAVDFSGITFRWDIDANATGNTWTQVGSLQQGGLLMA